MTFSTSNNRQVDTLVKIPHQGSLCRIEGPGETTYVLEILLEKGSTHKLVFDRKDFDFSFRLFSIMDTESRGYIQKLVVEEFMTQRCPVFWRRDDALEENRSTFEEVWMAVASCSTRNNDAGELSLNLNEICLGGWMVFCRFVALAQYLEAKRRFSGRHLQQTMRHRNAPRGSELVMVNVPPAASPVKLAANVLAQYEREKCLPMSMPELDLDHSLLAAHDVLRRRRLRRNKSTSSGSVKISLFGSSTSLLSSNSSSLEFCLTFTRNCGNDEVTTTVRRSMKDMKWLNDTFISHKKFGGTLCGRILPPFLPGERVFVAMEKDDYVFGDSGGALSAAANAGVELANAGVVMASAGVGILKSLWGGYVKTTEQGYKSYQEKSPTKRSSNITRHLERYLNYLLEHRALSTSFPLNTILKASQSGLEAAKAGLEAAARTAREIKDQTPQIDDGKTSSFWSLHVTGRSVQPNLAWVRTVAQAAVALKLHGVLETTGLPSASARLQHASLPSFDSARKSAWADDDEGKRTLNESEETAENIIEDSFEKGVTHVQDELASDCLTQESDDQGYELLPLPVPLPERQILNASIAKHNLNFYKETRFRYGRSSLQERLIVGNSVKDEKQVFIGEMSIDENIDKLREVIGSVDSTLSRCMASSCGIERSRRIKSLLHLEILRGLDSWEGLKGKCIYERALLKGVSGMEQSRELYEESDLTLIDDLSWQTALSHSAVLAAEDVRSTVRAARTATNAKVAAVSAADIAQSICDKGKLCSMEEARAAQTRASITQSHAIHAAVVEHEAKTMKRRATLALAHDVKCWNAHRKTKILEVCLGFAKSQHEATRRAVDAWSCLSDGYVGSNMIIPTTHSLSNVKPYCDKPDTESTIFASIENEGRQPMVVAVEHKQLKLAKSADITDECSTMDVSLVVKSPISEKVNDISKVIDKGVFSIDKEHDRDTQLEVLDFENDHLQIATDVSVHPTMATQSFSSSEKDINAESFSTKNERGALTSSMQSLVDGLMNWGEVDVEDTFALPIGMAASIALEESDSFG